MIQNMFLVTKMIGQDIAPTQIYSQDTVILKKINELEYRINNLEKQIASRA